MKAWYELAVGCPLYGEKPSCYETFFVPRMGNFPDFFTISCGDCGIEIQGETAEEALHDWDRRPHD